MTIQLLVIQTGHCISSCPEHTRLYSAQDDTNEDHTVLPATRTLIHERNEPS